MSEGQPSTGNVLFSGGIYRLAMGLAPLHEDEWLAPDAALSETLAAKHELLATRRDEVFRALAEADDASVELLLLLAEHLPRHYPAIYQRVDDRLLNRATGETWDLAARSLHPLDLAGRLVAEDLCLMQASDDGYRLVAASLCAPNRWRLIDKLGRPLDAIHAPVPGYAAALGRPVAHFCAALKPDRILGRVNWGIADDPARFQPVARDLAAAMAAADAGAALWLRVERQSLRRLPRSGAILFTIRTEITRLDHVIGTRGDASDLAGAIRDMSPATLRYKHLTAIAPALLAWLDAYGDVRETERHP
ncbi:MAG TPA: DUF3445 domain-containing protein [Stellaceae bacterium]|jgi:hypothetical protein|nr:DUF3445 domain-containing protein [Stellaceae bacterium]